MIALTYMECAQTKTWKTISEKIIFNSKMFGGYRTPKSATSHIIIIIGELQCKKILATLFPLM